MLMTTLAAAIRAARPCEDGYRKLVTYLGGCKSFGMDTEFPISRILESNDLADMLWVVDNVLGDKRLVRLFGCDCAERVLPHFETRYPDDRRPRNAIETAQRFAVGEATKEELAAAWGAAWDAAAATPSAGTGAAAQAAWAAACAAARATAPAAGAAAHAAAAARASEEAWQIAHLRALLDGEPAC